MAEPPAVEVRALTKQFGAKRAVDHLTFHVPQGTITGFIGPNGAGKTTTLRMLATLLEPDYGSIYILGYAIQEHRRYVRHNMGFMPDQCGFYQNMEVQEYLDFFAATYSIPFYKRRRLIAELLELLDLRTKTHALITELSRGMQQRLSLGRALVHDPKLLLLDEPASGLDPRARIELMELLRELRRMGKTIFISSHILAELKELCDFVVIIEQGRMVYHGTVSEAVNAISHNRGRLRLVLAEAKKAEADLQKWPGIMEVEFRDDRTLLVVYDCTRLSPALIIKQLVKHDYELEEVTRDQANLEDVFMSLTEGGVA